MARVHIPLTIVRPGVEEKQQISFHDVTATDSLVIPYRYPFVDIKNYSALQTAGYFRHATNTVGDRFGTASITSNTETNLGFQLPMTEKLILLVQLPTAVTDGTGDQYTLTLTVTGSTQYKKTDVTYTWNNSSGTGLWEIDLYEFGLYIQSGHVTLTFSDDNSNTEVIKADVALIARMG